MISIKSIYVIVDDYDEIWQETIASNRHDCWKQLATVCQVPKPVLVKRGFKCIPAKIQTAEYARMRKCRLAFSEGISKGLLENQ